jgi:hypothetical protein
LAYGVDDLVQVAVVGISTGFGSALGAELGKVLVEKVWKKAEKRKGGKPG